MDRTLFATCNVVACDQSASGRYLHVRPEGAVEFQVCADHFARIEGGEVPRVLPERFGLAELDGGLVLVMDPL